MNASILALLVVAVLSWPGPGWSARRLGRLNLTGRDPAVAAARPEDQLAGATSAGSQRAASTRFAQGRRWLLAAAAAGAVLTAVGGVTGLVGGVLAGAVSAWVLARGESESGRRLRDRRAADLPGALDLVRVCLGAGQPVGRALAHVAAVLDGPLADDFAVAAALHGLGADVRSVWAERDSDPVLAPVAQAMARTGHSGAALSTALATVAQQCRGQVTERAEVAAQRVGVYVLAPLGLCFLPAFVCLGVVPTILGIAGTVLG